MSRFSDALLIGNSIEGSHGAVTVHQMASSFHSPSLTLTGLHSLVSPLCGSSQRRGNQTHMPTCSALKRDMRCLNREGDESGSSYCSVREVMIEEGDKS